jgi:ribonuclease HI
MAAGIDMLSSMSDKKPRVELYTDGARSGNPGPGGWAALLEWNDKKKEISGGEKLTTNNRMEMKAVIEGLKALRKPCHVKIHSDSALIVNAFTKGWIQNWKRKGWKKADKKPVENRDLWEEMLRAMQKHKVSWIKVKGHSNNKLNNRVDKLAVKASKKF